MSIGQAGTGQNTAGQSSAGQSSTEHPDAPPARDSEQMLSVGEVSRRTGVAVSALHFYERLGLIASTRTAGNQRRYRRHMIRRISLITVAKRVGIPLADVQRALEDVPLDRTPSAEDWQRASTGWKQVLEQRRHAIERLERELTGCIGCGCLSMEACSLANPNDSLGTAGAGARRIHLPESA